MSVEICPRCQQRYTIMPNTGDYVHQCSSGNPARDQEDVFELGSWEDYTGSKTNSPKRIMTAGDKNKDFGTRAWVEGASSEERSERGRSKDVFRQRQHLHYIPGKGDC